MSRNTLATVVFVIAVALVAAYEVGKQNSTKSATPTTTTAPGTKVIIRVVTETPVHLGTPPTTGRTTATCQGVTFSWTSGIVCARSGKTATVNGVQVTASSLHLVVGQFSNTHRLCVDAAVVNKSGQSASYASRRGRLTVCRRKVRFMSSRPPQRPSTPTADES